MIETILVKVMTSINFKHDWIVDSGCSHHLIDNNTKFIDLRQYKSNNTIITTDNTIHLVENEDIIIISYKDNDSRVCKSLLLQM